MIEETGTVVAVHPNELIVEVLRTSACKSCQARQGCGQAVLAEWGDADAQQQKNHFQVPYKSAANVGDQVTLGMNNDTVSRVAMLVYLAPLALGFLGMILTSSVGGSELSQLFVASVFFLLAFVLMSRLKLNRSPKLVPVVIRLYPASKDPGIIASSP